MKKREVYMNEERRERYVTYQAAFSHLATILPRPSSSTSSVPDMFCTCDTRTSTAMPFVITGRITLLSAVFSPAGFFLTYNPQNEACNASRTKRAKNKTKREAQTKRSVPSVRFFITAATLPFFKKFSPDFAGVCGLTPARLRLSPAPLHYI